MNILGYEIRRPETKTAQFEDVLQRLVAAQEGLLGGAVTPESCMQSPTVQAIVQAISRRLSVTPIHLYERGTRNGREIKKRLPDHPVAKLLDYPNAWQTRVNFWADAASAYIRYGNFYAYKSRGATGPIRELVPLHPRSVTVKQDARNYAVTYEVNEAAGTVKELPITKMFHARGPARNYIQGDSPVKDVAQSIALEILAEKFGASFFANGALPLLIFKYLPGTSGFKTKEAEQEFIASFQQAFTGDRRHRAMLLPKGLESSDPIRVENDKAQMIESRRYQRTVIAGAFGVPPNYVGDLERATFNNVEQQTIQFTADVIYPVAQAFEAAMERDLLTDQDYRAGVVIRFNLDSILRADFKTRQEGLQIQRVNGVISPNEWREIEGKNPLDDDKGGEEYLRPANMLVAGQEPIEQPIASTGDETTTDSSASDQATE